MKKLTLAREMVLRLSSRKQNHLLDTVHDCGPSEGCPASDGGGKCLLTAHDCGDEETSIGNT
jgi:hypothetical protein